MNDGEDMMKMEPSYMASLGSDGKTSAYNAGDPGWIPG